VCCSVSIKPLDHLLLLAKCIKICDGKEEPASIAEIIKTCTHPNVVETSMMYFCSVKKDKGQKASCQMDACMLCCSNIDEQYEIMSSDENKLKCENACSFT